MKRNYTAPRPGGFRKPFGNRGFRGNNNNRRVKSWSYFELFKVIEERNRLQPATTIKEEYAPKHKFDDFNICPELKKNIAERNFPAPTPIQDQSIPVIIDGKDIIGIANTGTGKTAAFLIPLINKVFKDRTQKVFILAPTRELALQIFDEFRMYSKNMRMYAAVCIGGDPIYRQKKDLSFNPSFVIGTPGRVKDLIRQRALNLSTFNNVVLDETDRMVDIGFINEIKELVAMLPKQRQSLFFSATISGKVREILEAFVQNAVSVSVKKEETSENVEQKVVKVLSHEKKVDKLHDLLIQKEFEKVLVFGRTKRGVQKLADELNVRGFKAGAIHGDKRQSQRERTLNQFKRSEISVLLATDVASRGIDIKDVSHVINYDMPESYEDYVHRIGRTGRANKKGVAVTFVE